MAIWIDADKCEGIGDCVDACPTEVIAKQDGKCVAVRLDECIECEACIPACPNSAIEMR